MISTASLTLLGAWLGLFCILAGLGHLVRRAFSLGPAGEGAWSDAFWLGYAAVIAALQVWHLWLPVDWRVDLVLCAGGVIGVLFALWTMRRRFARSLGKAAILLVALAPILCWVVVRAMAGQIDFDSGFYHFSAIRWLNEYAIVPGVGNLHYRLAFNQTFFLFVAALNFFPAFNQGYHVANSLLFMLVVGQLAYHTLLALRYPGEISPYRLCNALLLPVVLYHGVPQQDSANLSSPSPDLSVFLFQIIVFLAFIRVVFSEKANPGQQRYDVFFVMVLSAIGITSKLSFGGFGVAAVAFALVTWVIRQREKWRRAVIQAALLLLIVIGCIGLPWVIRGIITSGYPAFPSAIGGLPVDYRIPAAITKEAEDWVYSFARQPRSDMYTVLSNWDWLQGWLRLVQEPFSTYVFAVPVLLAAGCIGISILLLLIRWIIQRRVWLEARFWLPFIVALAAVAFWFFSAPDPRFAGASVWLLALWGTIILLHVMLGAPGKGLPRGVAVILVLVPIAASAVVVESGYERGVDLSRPYFLPLPVTALEAFETKSGLTINVSGDPNTSLLLWDAPLPSSPYRLSRLEARGGSLQDGFRLPPDASLSTP